MSGDERRALGEPPHDYLYRDFQPERSEKSGFSVKRRPGRPAAAMTFFFSRAREYIYIYIHTYTYIYIYTYSYTRAHEKKRSSWRPAGRPAGCKVINDMLMLILILILIYSYARARKKRSCRPPAMSMIHQLAGLISILILTLILTLILISILILIEGITPRWKSSASYYYYY